MACLLLAHGGYYLLRYFVALKYWIKTSGHIIEIKIEESSDSNSFKPCVKYTSLDSEEISSEHITLPFNTWSVGDEVDVFFNPRNKKNFALKEKQAPLIHLLTFSLGAVILYDCRDYFTKAFPDLLHYLQLHQPLHF